MDLFGKKKLRKRIEELEEEKKELKNELKDKREQLDSLDERWKKEKERYKDAVSKKQKAEKENNRLKDRIESLEDHLQKMSRGEKHITEKESISASRAYSYFSSLENFDAGDKNALTVYRSPEDNFTGSDSSEILVHEPLCIRSIFISPLPLENSEYRSGKFALNHIREKMDRRTLYIHVSAGGSGIGIFRDMKLEESRIIRSDVKSKHKKGGYSQKRFERLREQQIESHLEEVREELKEFRDTAFEQVLIAFSTESTGDIRKVLEEDAVEVSSRQGHIKSEDDLERSFQSGIGFKHLRLSDEMAEEMVEKLGEK